jgi:hypothetical protein
VGLGVAAYSLGRRESGVGDGEIVCFSESAVEPRRRLHGHRIRTAAVGSTGVSGSGLVCVYGPRQMLGCQRAELKLGSRLASLTCTRVRI